VGICHKNIGYILCRCQLAAQHISVSNIFAGSFVCQFLMRHIPYSTGGKGNPADISDVRYANLLSGGKL